MPSDSDFQQFLESQQREALSCCSGQTAQQTNAGSTNMSSGEPRRSQSSPGLSSHSSSFSLPPDMPIPLPYQMEPQFDFVMFCSKTDMNAATEYKDLLLHLLHSRGYEGASGVMFNDPSDLSEMIQSGMELAEELTRRASFILFYVTENFKGDLEAEAYKEDQLLSSFYKDSKRYSVIPVWTKPKRDYENLPSILRTYIGLEPWDEKYYSDKAFKMFTGPASVKKMKQRLISFKNELIQYLDKRKDEEELIAYAKAIKAPIEKQMKIEAKLKMQNDVKKSMQENLRDQFTMTTDDVVRQVFGAVEKLQSGNQIRGQTPVTPPQGGVTNLNLNLTDCQNVHFGTENQYHVDPTDGATGGPGTSPHEYTVVEETEEQGADAGTDGDHPQENRDQPSGTGRMSGLTTGPRYSGVTPPSVKGQIPSDQTTWGETAQTRTNGNHGSSHVIPQTTASGNHSNSHMIAQTRAPGNHGNSQMIDAAQQRTAPKMVSSGVRVQNTFECPGYQQQLVPRGCGAVQQPYQHQAIVAANMQPENFIRNSVTAHSVQDAGPAECTSLNVQTPYTQNCAMPQTPVSPMQQMAMPETGTRVCAALVTSSSVLYPHPSSTTSQAADCSPTSSLNLTLHSPSYEMHTDPMVQIHSNAHIQPRAPLMPQRLGNERLNQNVQQQVLCEIDWQQNMTAANQFIPQPSSGSSQSVSPGLMHQSQFSPRSPLVNTVTGQGAGVGDLMYAQALPSFDAINSNLNRDSIISSNQGLTSESLESRVPSEAMYGGNSYQGATQSGVESSPTGGATGEVTARGQGHEPPDSINESCVSQASDSETPGGSTVPEVPMIPHFEELGTHIQSLSLGSGQPPSCQ